MGASVPAWEAQLEPKDRPRKQIERLAVTVVVKCSERKCYPAWGRMKKALEGKGTGSGLHLRRVALPQFKERGSRGLHSPKVSPQPRVVNVVKHPVFIVKEI